MRKRIISAVIAMALSATSSAAFAADVQNTYEGGETVIVQTDNGTILADGTDYTLEYKDNVKAGTAAVIVHFIGNYSGEKEQTFQIKKKSSGNSGGGGGGNGGGWGGGESSSDSAGDNGSITVKDKSGNQIQITQKEDNGKIIIILPDGTNLTPDNPITITVTNKKGNPMEADVIVRDTKGNEASGRTDKKGQLTVPKSAAAPSIPDHPAYIHGYEDGTFEPENNITRAEAASMLCGVMAGAENDGDVSFDDVKREDWFEPAVAAMTSAGLIHGYTDNTFRPDNNITRAEFVTMLMQNTDMVQFEALPFSDVFDGLWSADYICAAYTAGYINGYEDGTFRPDDCITRAEAVVIVNRMLGRTDFVADRTNPFADIDEMYWAYAQILEAAVNHNIGYGE